MITLEQLLQSRDERAAFQQELLKNHPGFTLVCFTVQLPGPDKRNALSGAIAKAGRDALETIWGPCLLEKDLETGYEAYWLAGEPAHEVKIQCCTLEETQPLGRLMDIDVLDREGPVSRQDVGLESRKCLLCEEPARVCMRAGRHTREELLSRIKEMVYGI